MEKKQKFLLPLINCHTHAAMVAFRGLAEDLALQEWLENYIWPAEQKHISPNFVYEHTKKAIEEMKRNGIKMFADMYFFEDEVARAAKELEMNVLIGEGLIDFPTPSAKNFDEGLEVTERLINKYRSDNWVKVAVSPHSIYTVSEENLIKAKLLADKYGVIYHIHLAETQRELEDCQIKHGLTPTQYLDKLKILDDRTILAHAVYLNDEDMQIVGKRGAKIIHCPLSNAKLGSGIAPIAKMVEQGITVALGTDGAASSNRLDIWEAGKIAALLQKASNSNPTLLPVREVVKMMTVNGLETLGFNEFEGKTAKEFKERIESEENNFDHLYHFNVEQLEFE